MKTVKTSISTILIISILFISVFSAVSVRAENIPVPLLNNCTADGYDYSKRGACLRLYDKDGNTCKDGYQDLRFTAGFTLPTELDISNIYDFGFVYTKSKYFNGGVDPITNNVYDYDTELQIGKSNINTLSVYRNANEKLNNYSVRKTTDNATAYTYNLVINVKEENWNDHYIARSYIKYFYGDKLYTVYDKYYSSRSVENVAHTAYRDCIGNKNTDKAQIINTHILSKTKTNLKMLSQNGKKIINSDGKTVQLTGVNLGNWLLQEAWMGAIDKGDNDHWGEYDTYETLCNRFGREKADALMDIYRCNFLCESDLDYLSSQNVNCVRVPFWYENFTYSNNSYSDFKKDSSGEIIGFSYLDWIINECGKRNIYVILDFHGLYGFQSTNHSCGKTDSMKLFSLSSKQGLFDKVAYVNKCDINSTYLTANKELWKDIALRYKDNPTVAGYDIMNEPLNNDNVNFRSPTSVTSYARGDCYSPVLNELYTAIRSVDSNHIIIMQGIWDIEELPKPSKYSWKNVAYSCHNYNYAKSEIEGKVNSYNNFSQNVPMFVGEFSASDYDSENSGKNLRRTATDIYNNAGFSWCTWTYKAVKKSNVGEDWYMKGINKNCIISPETAQYSDIKTAWSKNISANSADITTSPWVEEMRNYYKELP